MEDRRLLAVSLTGGGTWIEQGPGIIFNGQVEGIPNKPVVGAVQTIALDPVSGKVYAGTVNGGVWVTSDISSTNPSWTAKTDKMPSLSIGAMAISSADHNLVVAGTGSFSNGGGRGGRSVGVYITEDGGDNWVHRGQSVFLDLPIRALAITNYDIDSSTTVQAILVGTNVGEAKKKPGLFASFDRGLTWERLSKNGGLPNAPVSDIEIDPGIPGNPAHPSTIYVAMPGKGVFKSTDLLTWTNITDDPTTSLSLASNIQLDTYRDGTTTRVYAGAVRTFPNDSDQLYAVFKSADQGTTWTSFAAGTLPFTTELSADALDNDNDDMIDAADPDRDAGLQPGGQGLKNFSLVANSRNIDVIYVGGDRQPTLTGNSQGCADFSARLFRGDNAGWSSIVCSAASNTSPHADSRYMEFFESAASESFDFILEADDAGVYRLTNPESVSGAARRWDSRNGTTNSLRITEVNSVAYDSVHDIFFSGHQDTGSAEQPSPGSKLWNQNEIGLTTSGRILYQSGDGSAQAFNVSGGLASRFSLGNNLYSFYRREFNAAGNQVDLPPLAPEPSGQNFKSQDLVPVPALGLDSVDVALIDATGCFCPTPLEFNRVASASAQLVTGYGALYESNNSGQALTAIETAPLPESRRRVVSAIAYGGRGKNASGVVVDAPNVIYAARGGNIAVRAATASVFTSLSNPNGANVSKGTIRDIVMNPDEWRIAYAIDDKSIYRTKDGTNGTQWSKLKLGNLSSLTTELFSIEVFNPTDNPNDEIIMVGARGGVFYTLNPRGANPVWRELGGGLNGAGRLPNAVVNDVHFDKGKDGVANTADDLIYVGTYGRGVWRLNNPMTALSGELTVSGTANADTITIKLSEAGSNATLDVTVNGAKDRFAYQMLDKIKINGLGGNDTIIIDVSNGLIGTSNLASQPSLIIIDGGADTDNIRVVNSNTLVSSLMFADIVGPASGAGGIQIRNIASKFLPASINSNIQFVGIEQPIVSQIANAQVAKLGFAFQKIAKASKSASAKGGNLAMGNVIENLSGSALRSSGIDAVDQTAAAAKRGIVRDGLGEIAAQFFESIDFSLDELGDSVIDADQLLLKLDGLDAVSGNVSKTSQNGVLRFDIEVNKPIEGISLLDLGIEEGAFAGLASIEGGIMLTADAKMRLVIGIDANGQIFVDPQGALDANNVPIPFISIANIHGIADGTGVLGMFDIELTSATIASDPDLEILINLIDPNPDDADAMLRLEDLDLEEGEIFSVAVTASPEDSTPDLTFTGQFDVKIFDTELFTDRTLTIQWPDANNPRNGIIIPGTGDNGIIDSLAAGVDQIVTGIQVLASTLEQSTGADLLATKIPLLNKTLGEVLDQQAKSFLVTGDLLLDISDPTTDSETGENEFRVRYLGDDLRLKNLQVGAAVDYQSIIGVGVTGTLKSFDEGTFVVSYTGSVSSGTPQATSSFSLPRTGGLSAQLSRLSDGIAFQIPTIEELIDHLADVTKIDSIRNVQVVGTFGQSDFGIQFPISFTPDPIEILLPIDFADQIASLKLDASATAQVIVQPAFNLTIGISLAAKKADGSDFSPLERVFVVATHDPNVIAGSAAPTGLPIASVGIQLQLDDPVLKGSVGFLDLNLGETTGVSPNKGIQLDLTGAIHFVDPDAGIADQRIPLNLLTSSFSDVVDFDFDGYLDIDGLTASAAVGNLGDLAGVTISLDGETGVNAPGHFENLSELGQVLGRINVGSFSNFDQFKNISAAEVLAALDLLIERLQSTGRGEVFSKPIPIVNRSVADLIDLGQVFLETIGKPDNDSSTATALKLQTFLATKLAAAGLPSDVQVSLGADAIRFHFTVSKSFVKKLPIAFQVGNGGISVDGDADLDLTATGTVHLTFGILTAAGLPLSERFFVGTDNQSSTGGSGVDVRLEANVGYVTAGQPTAPTPLSLDVVLGPIGFHVTGGRVLVGLNVGANLSTSNANSRIPLTDLGSASIQPTFNGTVQAVIPIDGDNSGGTVGSRPTTLTGDDALILVGGRFTNLASFSPSFGTTSTLNLPSVLTTPIADNNLPATLRIEAIKVVELINKQFLNLGTLIEGLERLLEWGDRVLDLDVLDRKIPFIGKSVRDGLNFLESDQPGAKTLRTVIEALVADGSDGLKANASHAAVDASLNVLRNALANIPNVQPIGQDFNGDGSVNTLDLVVPTKSGVETTGVIVRFKYNPSFTTSRPFDLGLDFLNLSGSGDVALQAGLELNLGFGITKSEGFFFVTDLPQPEFKIGGVIQPNLTLAAKLGRLDVDVAIDPTSYMSVDFSMNVIDPSGDGKLTLSELTNFSQLSSVLPSNNAQLNVETHLVGSIETKLDANNRLPGFGMGVNVDWRVADSAQPDGFRGIDLLHLNALPAIQRIPQVKLTDITLDVGSFVTAIVKPIFEKISQLGLIPPALKLSLDTEIPIVNKSVKAFLREAIVLNQNLTDAEKENRLRVFDLLLNITTFLSEAESFANLANSNSLRLNFGDINVGQSANNPNQAVPTASLTDAQVTVDQNGATKALDQTQQTDEGVDIPGSGIPVIKDFITKLGEMGIFFPILRLSNLVQLIVGNDTDVVLIDLPEFKIEKVFNQTFPLIGGGLGDIVRVEVAAFLGGGFTFTAHLAGGFDTSGLRNGRFIDGFYLGDFEPNSTGSANGQIDSNDKERPEISFTGFVQAGIVGQAEIRRPRGDGGFDIGSIEGYFKLGAEVNVDLNDDNEINGVAPVCDTRTIEERHDGKLHLDEIRMIQQSHNNEALSILELNGGLFAEIGLHITVLGGLLYDEQFTKRFDLLSFEGLTFPVLCVNGSGSGDSCSAFGEKDLGSPSLRDDGLFDIDISPQDLADPRTDPLIAIAEDFNGNPFDGGGFNTFDPDDFTINDDLGGFTFTTTDPEIDLIADRLEIGQGVTFVQDGIEIGAVITNVTANSFTVRNHAGPRPAALRSFTSSSPISVFSPNETLTLAQGGLIQTFGPSSCSPDNIPGGTESIGGITTEDDEEGLGPGNNTFYVAPSVTTPIKVSGGKGNDVIVIAGSGPSTVVGGPGNDSIEILRGPGTSSTSNAGVIKGGSGDDTIIGGRGSDTLLGEDGDDVIFDDSPIVKSTAATGNDRIVGGGGKDSLVSRGGNDELTGDYHESLDRRPTLVADQKEDGDIIVHDSVDAATIYADNRGEFTSIDGPKPDETRLTDDSIVSTNSDDEIYVRFGDQFNQVSNTGTIKIGDEISGLMISSTQLSGTGQKDLPISKNSTVEITNAIGSFVIQTDPLGGAITLSAITDGVQVSFENGPVVNVQGASGIEFQSSAGDDTLTIDFKDGNPLPVDGISFTGVPNLNRRGGSGDQIRIMATGEQKLDALLKPSRGGFFTIDSRTLKFVDVATIEALGLSSAVLRTSNASDVHSIVGALSSSGDAALSITGASGNSNTTNWIIADTSSVEFDAGNNDGATTADTIRIDTSALRSRGLTNLSVSTGPGSDTVSIDGPSLALPANANLIRIDTGTGSDQLFISGDSDFTLNGTAQTVTSPMFGNTTLAGLSNEQVFITGGTSVNRFVMTNWSGSVTLDGGAATDTVAISLLGGSLTTIDELTLSSNITVNSSKTTATISGRINLGTIGRTLSVADGSSSIDLQVNALISGTAPLTKTGSGTALFSQSNLHSGTTTVSSGTLLIDGNSNSPAVLNGGTIGGNGTLPSLTGTVGTISPGITSGLLTLRDRLALTSRETFKVDLNGTTLGQTNAGYDSISVVGTVDLGLSQLSTAVGFPSQVGTRYTIINNDGTDAVIGTFAGLPEGATFVANGFTFTVSYRGGSGNDVVLTHSKNTAPAFQNRIVTPVIVEGGVVELTGKITEPDVGDLFTLIVDWGDGTAIEEFEFDPALGLDVRVQHRYLDDRSSHTNANQHLIHLLWRDQHGAANVGDLTTTIANAAPAVTARAILTTSLGTELRASGRFTDPGIDSWTATVDFGDGTSTKPLPLGVDGSYDFEHLYQDPGLYTVKVEVVDDDGGTGVSEFQARVIRDNDGELSLIWWQNGRFAEDVNDDGEATALDALTVINAIALRDSGQPGSFDLANRLGEIDPLNPSYIDVNGDNIVSASDALQIINYLARNLLFDDGEGELTTAAMDRVRTKTENNSEADDRRYDFLPADVIRARVPVAQHRTLATIEADLLAKDPLSAQSEDLEEILQAISVDVALQMFDDRIAVATGEIH